uniref:Histone-lysine N-methyltransferase SETMAR n=1 Tax=Anolis carolinensis TaxID=28377 RepID=G1KYT3_ANOCA
ASVYGISTQRLASEKEIQNTALSWKNHGKSVLRCRWVRKEKGNVFLQHDSARPHTSHDTTTELQRLALTTVRHPPYSPDLAPSDFHLFPIMKENLWGHYNASDEDVERTVRCWLRKKSVDFFCDGFRKLVHRWQKCIQLSGKYVEK